MKPSSAATPQLLLRSLATAKAEPIIAPSISSGVAIGWAANTATKLSCMPTQAPATVGSNDSASSQ